MSNFAAIVQSLVISGSRKSDGTANASGLVWCYIPDTSTQVNVYADAAATVIVTQPITLDTGGRIPQADYPDGLFVTQPVRLLVQDSTGQTSVSDSTFVPSSAGATGVDNDGFTDSTLDDVLTDAFTSFGGVDWKYKESGGATARTVKAKFAEGGISVKDFGAVGDGVAIDTTAVQAAMSRAKVLSCNVLFPAGTYKVDQALTLTSATGVSFVGAGPSATTITTTHASANIFTLTSCTGFAIRGMTLTAAATSSGSAIAMSACVSVVLSEVAVNASGGGTFLIPLVVSGSSSAIRIDNCPLTNKASDTAARSVKLTDTTDVLITGGILSSNSGAAVEFASGAGSVRIVGSTFFAGTGNPKGCLWSSTGHVGNFTVIGCPSLRAGLGLFSVPFDMSALTTDPRFRQFGNEVDGYTTDVTSGSTVTPDRSNGWPHIRIRGTTTGSAYTVAAPIPTPINGTSGMRNLELKISFYNNASGAITGWTLNAVYHTTGAISTTDGEITTVTFVWDPDAAVWRETARAVTT